MSELPSSRKITVIDLIDLDRPVVVDTVEGFLQPSTVSGNAAGDLVAVTHTLSGSGVDKPVALYRFEQGKLSLLSTPAIPDWPFGNLLMDAAFHPELDILALTDYSQPRLTLVKVIQQGSEIKLERWGNSVKLETAPYTAKFTSDGRHVLSNAMYVGPDIEAPRGTVSSIRLDASQDENGNPQHSIVSRSEVGVMPERLAVSPDGLWAVTANLERSTPSLDSPSQGFFSSLSLLRVDPVNGTLSTVGTYTFDGILPEGVVFDSSSRYVASTTFDQYDGRIPGGSIDIWRISGDHADPTRVELVKTSVSVPVPCPYQIDGKIRSAFADDANLDSSLIATNELVVFLKSTICIAFVICRSLKDKLCLAPASVINQPEQEESRIRHKDTAAVDHI
ncbi:hypothetical protein CcaCcLH18_13631 [Colletotrichum camelliae]|nr:hypothetical protein CcaCcLH18_13631 [Colletotrichum camelliae]